MQLRNVINRTDVWTEVLLINCSTLSSTYTGTQGLLQSSDHRLGHISSRTKLLSSPAPGILGKKILSGWFFTAEKSGVLGL